MSIHSISSTAPGLGFGRPRPGPSGGRRPAPADRSAFSHLTAGDRDLIEAMFGPEVLTTGRDADGRPVGVPSFVWRVIDDRRSGRLPAGTEITGSYLEPVPELGPAAAGRAFLSRRRQGATLDIRV